MIVLLVCLLYCELDTSVAIKFRPYLSVYPFQRYNQAWLVYHLEFVAPEWDDNAGHLCFSYVSNSEFHRIYIDISVNMLYQFTIHQADFRLTYCFCSLAYSENTKPHCLVHETSCLPWTLGVSWDQCFH
jgi:hypothetical protein